MSLFITNHISGYNFISPFSSSFCPLQFVIASLYGDLLLYLILKLKTRARKTPPVDNFSQRKWRFIFPDRFKCSARASKRFGRGSGRDALSNPDRSARTGCSEEVYRGTDQDSRSTPDLSARQRRRPAKYTYPERTPIGQFRSASHILVA